MYLKEKTVKLLGIKNIILTIFGVLCILLDGSYIVSEFVYYRNDPDTAQFPEDGSAAQLFIPVISRETLADISHIAIWRRSPEKR